MSDFLDLKLSMEEAFGERERDCNLMEETWEALGGGGVQAHTLGCDLKETAKFIIKVFE